MSTLVDDVVSELLAPDGGFASYWEALLPDEQAQLREAMKGAGMELIREAYEARRRAAKRQARKASHHGDKV